MRGTYNKFLLKQAIQTNPTATPGKCEHCHSWDKTKSAATGIHTTGLCKKWGSYTRPITTCTMFQFKGAYKCLKK